MFHLASHSTLNNSTSSFLFTSPVLLSPSSPRTQTCCPRIQLSTVKIHGRMVLPRNSTPPQFKDPKRIELNRILVSPQNQIIDDQDDIEEIGVKPLSYSQSLTHSAYDSAESIATPPDSETSDYVRCWPHHCIHGNDRKMKEKQKLIVLNEKD